VVGVLVSLDGRGDIGLELVSINTLPPFPSHYNGARLLILLSVITFPFFFANVGDDVEKAAAASRGLWCLIL